MGKDCSCCGKPCVDRKEPEVKESTGSECPECHSDPCKCGEKTEEDKEDKKEDK